MSDTTFQIGMYRVLSRPKPIEILQLHSEISSALQERTRNMSALQAEILAVQKRPDLCFVERSAELMESIDRDFSVARSAHRDSEGFSSGIANATDDAAEPATRTGDGTVLSAATARAAHRAAHSASTGFGPQAVDTQTTSGLCLSSLDGQSSGSVGRQLGLIKTDSSSFALDFSFGISDLSQFGGVPFATGLNVPGMDRTESGEKSCLKPLEPEARTGAPTSAQQSALVGPSDFTSPSAIGSERAAALKTGGTGSVFSKDSNSRSSRGSGSPRGSDATRTVYSGVSGGSDEQIASLDFLNEPSPNAPLELAAHLRMPEISELTDTSNPELNDALLLELNSLLKQSEHTNPSSDTGLGLFFFYIYLENSPTSRIKRSIFIVKLVLCFSKKFGSNM